jgi:hypothetical protein
VKKITLKGQQREIAWPCNAIYKKRKDYKGFGQKYFAELFSGRSLQHVRIPPIRQYA